MTENSKKDTIEMYRKARKNLVDYRYILLSVSEGEVKPTDFQYKWSDILLNGKTHTAIEGFRESAKSQIVLRACPLYSLTFPSKNTDYIVIIKNNTTLARNKLKEVEREYTTNPLISANMVKIVEQSSDVFSVDVKDESGETINVRIEAYGKGASIRGLSNLDRRPKIVICDDLQDLADAESETVSAGDWNWFLSDVMFLGQYTRIFLIGNNLGEKCIVERIFANAKSLEFETMLVPCMADGKSSWPEKYTVEDIEKEKAAYAKMGKIDIWLREKMCLATSEETRTFHANDYRYYVPNIINKIRGLSNVYFTIDPAHSQEEDSCFRAIVVNCVDQDNKWFIANIAYGRWQSDEFIKILFEQVAQWKPLEVGIERGEYKDVIEPFIYKEMSRRNIFFDIKPIEHAKQGSKLERVKMLGPRFKAHQIWFPEYADWLPELKAELAGVTKNAFKSLYVDLIDALAMQEQIAIAPVGIGTQEDLPRYAMPDNTLESLMGAGDPQHPRMANTVTNI